MEKQENDKQKRERPEWVWALVGNIIDEHPYGEDRKIVRGTKHFKPGTKVYCLRSHWGDGYESIPVIGRSRKGKLNEIVIRRYIVENFRLKQVFSPSVIEMMERYHDDDWRDGHQRWFEGWGNSDEDRREIEQYLRWINFTDEEFKKFDLLNSFDELRLEMSFLETALSFSAVIKKQRKVKEQWVCHLHLYHRCDEVTWKNCCAKEFTSRCEEPEREFVWELLYTGEDGVQLNVETLRPENEYWPWNVDLLDSISDCCLHLLDSSYGQKGSKARAFNWRLSVHKGDVSIVSEGIDFAPEGIRDLVRLMQVYGFPISKDVVSALSMQRGCHLRHPLCAPSRACR